MKLSRRWLSGLAAAAFALLIIALGGWWFTLSLAVIVHLAQWGDQYLADDHGAPLTRIHKQCEHTLQAQLHCSHCGETVAAQDIRVEENTGFEGKILQARVQDTAG